MKGLSAVLGFVESSAACVRVPAPTPVAAPSRTLGWTSRSRSVDAQLESSQCHFSDHSPRAPIVDRKNRVLTFCCVGPRVFSSWLTPTAIPNGLYGLEAETVKVVKPGCPGSCGGVVVLNTSTYENRKSAKRWVAEVRSCVADTMSPVRCDSGIRDSYDVAVLHLLSAPAVAANSVRVGVPLKPAGTAAKGAPTPGKLLPSSE